MLIEARKKFYRCLSARLLRRKNDKLILGFSARGCRRRTECLLTLKWSRMICSGGPKPVLMDNNPCILFSLIESGASQDDDDGYIFPINNLVRGQRN